MPTRALAGPLLALALAAAPGCRGCDERAPVEVGASAPSPVPEPAGLLAEFVVPKPNGTWQKVRSLAGGPAQLLPQGFPLLVASLLGLPIKAAELIDSDVPLVGALAVEGAGERLVAGVHVRDGARFVAALTEGAEARYAARPDATPLLTLLEARPGAAPGPALGVLGNYALVGREAEALRRLGPYVARTLPTRPPPEGDDLGLVAKRQGLAGALRGRLEGLWAGVKAALEAGERRERARHGGAAPTFAEPAAALAKADAAVADLLGLLGDLDDVRAAVVLDERGVRARAALSPAGGGGPAGRAFAAMAAGPASPLLELPGDVTLALLTRDSAEARRRDAGAQAKALSELFAGRLPEGDGRRVDEALALWAAGRGDWLAVGVNPAAGRRALYAASAVVDADALDRGVRRLLELPKVPAFAAPIAQWAGALRVGEATALEGAGGSLVRVERRPLAAGRGGARAPGGGKEGAPAEPERFEIAWAVGPARASFAAAADGRRALAALAAAPAAERLGNDSEVRRGVEALGGEVSFALLALPLRALGGAEGPAAPLLLAAGRSGPGAWVRCEAAPLAARALVALLSERTP
ncbi:MAG TPA: hypothetical protein VFS43_10910 [Polyangiaceae bacterium]|nr:hypothetical protein [Polyangiaceae bacterium]